MAKRKITAKEKYEKRIKKARKNRENNLKKKEILFRRFPYPLTTSDNQQYQFDSYAGFKSCSFIHEKECDYSLY
jgi:hypothetical protein